MNIVILAAGQGKRMHSNLPKVLHPIAGKPLAQHVIDTARCLDPEKLIVVYGHGGEIVRSTLQADDITIASAPGGSQHRCQMERQDGPFGRIHAIRPRQPIPLATTLVRTIIV